MFMCVELMLNAVNLTFVTFGADLNDIGGEISVFFVLVVAAAEVRHVVAPFEGRIEACPVDDGSPVTIGQPLLRMSTILSPIQPG